MEAYDADELVSYRSLSNLAILAFVLGVLSPLALVAPLLSVIPLAGLGVALLAIRKISVQPGVLTGMTLAKVALFLCVFSLVVAPTKSMVSAYFYRQQADLVARDWLQTIAKGDLENAVGKLTATAYKGLLSSEAAATHPALREKNQPGPTSAIESLGKDALVKMLRNQAQGGPLKLKALSMKVDTSRSQPVVAFEYQINAEGDSTPFMVYCIRADHPSLGQIWQIEAWKADDHSEHSH